MKQTLVLKLEADEAQEKTLLTTMEAFNSACQYVADKAFEYKTANKIMLQTLVYNEVRSRYGISSQMAVRAISKACEEYKTDKQVRALFDCHDDMILDPRLVSFKGLTHVSFLSTSGRMLVPFRFLNYEEARPGRIAGQADLAYRTGQFILYVCIDMNSPPPDTEAEEAETSEGDPEYGR